MAVFENGRALVIAIADYAHINRLPQTVIKDAKNLISVLTDLDICGYRSTSVIPLLNEKATKEALRAELQNAAAACGPNSTFVFYASCHGGRIEDGKHTGEYLLPVGAVYQNDATLAETSLSGPDLSQLLRAIPSRRLVAIFDCCHAAGVAQPKAGEIVGVKKGLSEQYYAQLSVGYGRVVFAACRDSEVSYVRPGDANSVFTKHLLAGLRGEALGTGGLIRVFDLFNYVQPKVLADEPNQHPVFKCEVEDNFPVALHFGGKAPALPPPAADPKDSFEYDVFLGYRQQEPDKDWTRKVLLPRLKAEGLRVCIDFECFALGGYLVTEMETAVEKSRYTLAVFSPKYLESNFAELERVLAQHLGLELSQRRFLGIMRQPCRPPLGTRARLWLDMQDDTEFEPALARLVQELRKPPGK